MAERTIPLSIPICVTPKSQKSIHVMNTPWYLMCVIISTDVLNKLGDKERTALLKAADESMMQMKDVIWPAAEKEAYDK